MTNITKFEDGEFTVIARDKVFDFFDDGMENFIKDGRAYIEFLNTTTFLFDWLKVYIKKHKSQLDFNKNCDSIDDIYDFVRTRFIEAGFKGDRSTNGFNPQILRKWINGEILISKREDAFRFGFVLKLNVTDMMEFMLKACLMSPFNFKSISESVYYFCFNSGKSYFDALRIINTIENTLPINNTYTENDTAAIKEIITQNIKDENELIQYLAENKSSFEKQYLSAIDALIEQVKIAYLHMNREEKISIDKIKSLDIENINISSVMEAVVGFNPRKTEKTMSDDIDEDGSVSEKIYDKNRCISAFSVFINKNLPTAKDITDHINFKIKKPSEKVLRNLLILFSFYNTYVKKNDNNEYADVEMFWDCTDKLLNECGFVQFYKRNPYDAIFSFCAIGENPLDTLKNFIYEYNFSDGVLDGVLPPSKEKGV